MSNRIHDLGIDRLPVDERIALAQDIWDSVAQEAGLLPIQAQEQAELERRLKEDNASPDEVTDWNAIKQEAQ
ncbi:MAG: addiction module protein, partial [Gammaproteobacteria bacterium]|nr:addiction module protein [Gammaproteobacteria bacterium]